MDHFPGHKGCMHTLHPGNKVYQHLFTRTVKKCLLTMMVRQRFLLLFFSSDKWVGAISKQFGGWLSPQRFQVSGEMLLWGTRTWALHCSMPNWFVGWPRCRGEADKVATLHKSFREHFHGRKFKWWRKCFIGANTCCALSVMISGLWNFLVRKWMNFSARSLMVK